MSNSVSPAQIRGARAMLGWSMMDLAKAAGVSILAVKRAEDCAPERASSTALQSIQGALEAVGVSFLADRGEGEGVRLRKAGM